MSDRDRRIRDRGAAVLGIVGTGRISQTYFDTAAASPVLELKACAARSVESARPMAERFGAEPLAFEDRNRNAHAAHCGRPGMSRAGFSGGSELTRRR